MDGVTVYGHHPECRVTFGRRGLLLFDKIPASTIITSLETISNVPLHIPAREAYLKVAQP